MTPQTPRAGRRRSLIALPVLVALVAVSACGDDSDSSADTTTAVTAPADTTEPASDTTAPTDDTEFWTGTAPNMTPVDDDTAAEWQALAEEALAKAEGTPGALIAVSHPDLGYWSTAIGDAEIDVDPMTLDHHSRIGSITKTFTAVAILQLVDAGSLSLDDTVAEVVPDIAEQFPETADITVQELLSMTSGLPDYANVPGAATAQAVEDPTKIWTPEDLIESALGASEVQPIGTAGYSTTNYAILGRMYEAVTGDTIEDGVTRVAEEAGLTDTALLPGDQNEMPDPSTHGYIDPAGVTALKELAGVDVEAGTDTTEWSLSWGGAGGGAYSTADDLLLWASTGLGNTLLSSELGTQRLQMDTFIAEASLLYGLGIMQQVEGWYGHTGQAIGWEALAMFNPETGASIAILINGTSGLSNFYPFWLEVFGLDSGGDESATDDTTTTTPSDDSSSGSETGDGTDAGAAPSGSAVLSIGDVTVEADIVGCTLAEPDVVFLAQGETAEFEVYMLDDGSGDAGVTVRGSFEFEGRGTVSFDPGAGIDQGTVTITGSGAAPDDGAPVEDFTIEATIESC